MLYVHVPFCRSKCAFCDYVQPIQTSDLLLRPEHSKRQAYLKAIRQEIRQRGKALAEQSRQVRVVYWGGGTASDLTMEEVRSIMDASQEAFDLGQVVEATIECSPDTINPSKL